MMSEIAETLSRYCGSAERAFHSESLPNEVHARSRSDMSENVSMYVRLGIRAPTSVSPKKTGVRPDLRKIGTSPALNIFSLLSAARSL